MSRRRSSGNTRKNSALISRSEPSSEQEIQLTGSSLIDYKILNYLDDAELYYVFSTNGQAKKYKEDQNFWGNRIEHYYPGAMKYKTRSTNKNYYINLASYEMSNGGATNAAASVDYEALDYMYSLGYIPNIQRQIYKDGKIRIFIWLKMHNVEFTEDRLIDALTFSNDPEDVKEVITYLYDHDFEFSDSILTPLIINGFFEIADMLIKELDLTPPPNTIDEAIFKEDPELLDEIIRRYDLYPDDIGAFKEEGIESGWGGFFDYTITMNPPIYPNEDDLNSSIEKIDDYYGYFLITKSIFRISKEFNLNLQYDRRSINEVFVLHYDRGYNINYGPERDNFSYPGDQQLEIWEWFISRGMFPTDNLVWINYSLESNFHFIRLLILYKHIKVSELFAIMTDGDLLKDMLGYSLDNEIYPTSEDLFVMPETRTNFPIILENYLNELSDRDYDFREASAQYSIINEIILLDMHNLANKLIEKYDLQPTSDIFVKFSIYDLKKMMNMYNLRPDEDYIQKARENGKLDIVRYLEENP